MHRIQQTIHHRAHGDHRGESFFCYLILCVLCDLRGLILFFIILAVSKTAVYSRVMYSDLLGKQQQINS
ncbi:hypothetical protein C5S39_08200 [Candidatus Methanophagaceae archaeon]|nr:hypothetical protein C5S39_08200 [Methanophagales archaeon]